MKINIDREISFSLDTLLDVNFLHVLYIAVTIIISVVVAALLWFGGGIFFKTPIDRERASFLGLVCGAMFVGLAIIIAAEFIYGDARAKAKITNVNKTVVREEKRETKKDAFEDLMKEDLMKDPEPTPEEKLASLKDLVMPPDAPVRTVVKEPRKTKISPQPFEPRRTVELDS